MVDAVELWEVVAEHVVVSVVPEAVVLVDVVEPEAVVSVEPEVVVSVEPEAVALVDVVELEVALEAVVAEAIKLRFYQLIKKIKSLFVNKQIRQQYD